MDKENNLEHNCNCGCESEHCTEEEHNCECGCNEEETDALVVDLEDEKGNVVTCEVADNFDYKENHYVLVQNPKDGSVYLFKVVKDGEEGEIIIPDDKEFEEATAYYKSLCDLE